MSSLDGPDGSASGRVDRRPLHVLYADDGEDNRFLIESYFRGSIHRVDVVADGGLAWERFQTTRYDLVVMDVHMPVVDGLTATRKMRDWEAARGLKETPIGALTADTRAGSRDRCRSAGCSFQLTKPISKEALLAAVERYAEPRVDTPTNTPTAMSARSAPAAHAVGKGEGTLAASGPPGIVVAVDRELAVLMPRYIDSRRADAVALLEAVAVDDFDKVWSIGHNMMGSAASYGLPFVGEMGGALVRAAEARDRDSVGRIARELAAYVERLNVRTEEPLGAR